MTEWILVSPLLTVLLGASAAMISHILYPPKKGEVAMRIAIFSILMATIQLGILGYRAYGITPSGLFRIDGLSLSLALSVMIFLFLSSISLYLEKNSSWPFTAVSILLLSTTSLLGLFANDGLLLCLAISTLLIFSRWSSVIWSNRLDSFKDKRGIVGLLGWFVFAGFCLVLLVQTVGSVRFEMIEKSVASLSQHTGFHIGFFGLLIVQAFGFLPAPIDPYFEDSKKLGQWSGVIISKLVIPTVFILLTIRWMWIFGFDLDLNSKTQVDLSLVLGTGIATLYLLGVWVLFTEQTTLRVVTHFGLQTMSLAFVPFFLKRPELIGIGLAHLCLMGFVSIMCMSALRELEVGTEARFSKLAEAVQNAPLRVQFIIGFALLVFVLPFSVPSKELIQALWASALTGNDIYSLFSAAVLLLMSVNLVLMSVRVVQTFSVAAQRNLKWDGEAAVQKIWSYSLLTVVLVLGVYPTPLYNYFAHSIKLLLKAN